jgi:hypothetical protein
MNLSLPVSRHSLALALLAVAAFHPALADEKPMLAIPGKVLFESSLDTVPGPPWKAAKGKWTIENGVLRGEELAADKHGAVLRMNTMLPDFVIEFEFMLDGARATSLSINAVKDHMSRIAITPRTVTVRRDDNDHDGPDQAITFAVFPAQLEAGVWHKARMEMVGDTMLGKVNDLAAWGSDPLFTQQKANPGLTVGGGEGQGVRFRNLRVREATLNPEWEQVRATLPKPGEIMAPTGAGKGKGKGKGKGAK